MDPNEASHDETDADGAEALFDACLSDGESRLEELVSEFCATRPEGAEALRAEVAAAKARGGLLGRGGAARLDEASGDASYERIGPYQPLRELGRGGQGVVYLAEDVRLHRVVALKVLRSAGALSDKLLLRFRREAEAASRLDHPGICAVYDAGTFAGIPYIAMRFVEGRTLAHAITTARTRAASGGGASDVVTFEDDAAPRPEPVAASSEAPANPSRVEILERVAVVEKAARALHAAHEAGIVHRDVKPGNIMVSPAGEPVILDFGMASDEASEISLTQTGELFGTPAYMSPEQLTARRIRLDRRTDVYSLAVTLYECVTLRRPFDGATREALYHAVQFKEAVRARRWNPHVPADLETVLEKGLEKDRERRYATALDFAEDLRRVRANEPIAARRTSPAGRLARWARRRPARAALAAVLLFGAPTVAGLAGYSVAKASEIRRGEELALAREIDARLENGYAELAHGDPRAAVALFEAALAMSPTSGEAIAGKAFALNACGDYEAVLRFIDAHPVADGGDFAVTRIRYEALSRLGREHEAEAFAKNAPRDARSALGYFLAGTIEMIGCEAQRNPEVFARAAEMFTRAALASPRPRLLYQAAFSHAAQHLGDAETARRSHDALLELWPDSSAAAYAAGCAMGDVDPVAAVRAYLRALELRPDDMKALGNMVYRLVILGRSEEAEAACRRQLAVVPDSAYAYFELGNALRGGGKLDAAEAAYRKSMALKRDVRTGFKLGSLLRERGDVDGALGILQEAAALDPGSASAQFHLGLALHAKGRTEEAAAAARRSIQISPGSGETFVNLGRALSDLGDPVAAEAAFRKAIELNPGLVAAHGNLGNALLAKGLPEEALASFQRAAEADPKDADARHNVGVALRTLGRDSEALEAFREALARRPNDAGIHDAIGGLLCDRFGDFPGAIAAFEKAIALKPDFDGAFRNLYFALQKCGDDGKIIEVSRRMIELRPDLPEGLFDYSLGMALGRRGESAEATKIWRKLVERRPKDARARTNLGVSLLEDGDAEGARKLFEEAVKLDPNFPDPRRYLGLALRADGEVDAAIKVWREAAERFPTLVRLWTDLGETYAGSGRLDDAAACLERAIELAPTDPVHHYNLGCVLQRSQDYEGAAEAQSRALALKPDFAEALCNLGDLRASQGRFAEALDFMRRGHAIGAARAQWAYPSAQWLTKIEGAALDEAERLAEKGFGADGDVADREKAAELVEALVAGWRKDVEAKRRIEAVAENAYRLTTEAPWVALRDSARLARASEAERGRWAAISATADELTARLDAAN